MLRKAALNDAQVTRAMIEAGPRLVPALRDAIHSPDEKVQRGALNVLGSLATWDSGVSKILTQALRDTDLRIRGDAADQFFHASQADADLLVPQLVGWLNDKNPDTRMAALQALGNLGPKAKGAITEIAAMLEHSDTDIRTEAIGVLGRIGPPAKIAETKIESCLNSENRFVRQEAAFSLARIDSGDAAAVPVLIEALGPDSIDQGQAIDCIRAMGPVAREALPALEHLLASGRHPEVSPNDSTVEDGIRIKVAGMIGQVGGSNAVPALSDALLHDPRSEVRIAALESLRKLDGQEAARIPALIAALCEKDQGIREGATDALAKLGTAATPALIGALKNPDLYIRDGAVQTLAKIDPLSEGAVNALAYTAVTDKSQTVRESAEIALEFSHSAAAKAAYETVKHVSPLPTPTPEASETNRLYSKDEIVATLPADNENEFLLSLTELLPIDDGTFLVSVHRGQDRADRLAIWKKVDDDRYRRLLLVEADPVGDETIGDPVLFTPKGLPEGTDTRFLDITWGNRRFGYERVFATEEGSGELREVKIKSPEEKYRSMMRSGEELTPFERNIFLDNGQPRFEFALAKKGDPDCCPTAGRIAGVYKIIREAREPSAPGSDTITEWTFVPENAKRESIVR